MQNAQFINIFVTKKKERKGKRQLRKKLEAGQLSQEQRHWGGGQGLGDDFIGPHKTL